MKSDCWSEIQWADCAYIKQNEPKQIWYSLYSGEKYSSGPTGDTWVTVHVLHKAFHIIQSSEVASCEEFVIIHQANTVPYAVDSGSIHNPLCTPMLLCVKSDMENVQIIDLILNNLHSYAMNGI